jgi:hypothetical protein
MAGLPARLQTVDFAAFVGGPDQVRHGLVRAHGGVAALQQQCELGLYRFYRNWIQKAAFFGFEAPRHIEIEWFLRGSKL